MEIPSGMFGIGEVHIGNDVHDAPVGFFWKAFVLAPVPRFHVEDGDVHPLGGDGRQAGIGVPQDQQGIGLYLDHELVAGVDDVAHGCSQIVPYGVHVHIWGIQLQIMEKHTVEVIIVILAGMGQ